MSTRLITDEELLKIIARAYFVGASITYIAQEAAHNGKSQLGILDMLIAPEILAAIRASAEKYAPQDEIFKK